MKNEQLLSYWRVTKGYRVPALHGAGRLPRQLSLLVLLFRNGRRRAGVSQEPCISLTIGCTDRWWVCMTTPSCGAHACSKQMPSSFLCVHLQSQRLQCCESRGDVFCVEHNPKSPFEEVCSAVLSTGGMWRMKGGQGVSRLFPPMLKAKKAAPIDRCLRSCPFPAEHWNSHSVGCTPAWDIGGTWSQASSRKAQLEKMLPGNHCSSAGRCGSKAGQVG